MDQTDLIIETIEEIRGDVNYILHNNFNFGIKELQLSNNVQDTIKQMFINIDKS